MEIFPSEIESVETAGEMDGNPVKMVKTIGGCYMMVGKKNKKDTVLGSASHPAILKYNIQKSYPGFRASLMKSEFYSQFDVQDKSANLPASAITQGFKLYQVKDNEKITISLTKHSQEIGLATLTPVQKGFKLNNQFKPEHAELFKSVSKTAVDAAVSFGRDIVV